MELDLSLASPFIQTEYLQVKQEHALKWGGTPLQGRLLALPANIRPSWKSLSGTKHSQLHFPMFAIDEEKGFYPFGRTPAIAFTKLYFLRNL